MKTTLDLPDKLMRSAKALAAKRGISFKKLVADALQRIIAETPALAHQPEWQRCFGAFNESSAETALIQDVIDRELSQVNPDDWQ